MKIKEIQVTKYETEDGKTFDTLEEAIKGKVGEDFRNWYLDVKTENKLWYGDEAIYSSIVFNWLWDNQDFINSLMHDIEHLMPNAED